MSDVKACPQCRECRYYYVTYRPAKPYGCRAMGFVSRRNPAQVVLESSGLQCQLFVARKQKTATSGTDWTT